MSQSLDTSLENIHTVLIKIREEISDSSVLEKVAILGEEVKSLQQFTEFRKDLRRILEILEKREVIRTNLGSSY
jgi:hypothetical protein